MFGIYRTLLAVLVLASHLGPVAHVGSYAVFAFYVLSGYLMTAILHSSYGYSRQGFLRYALNRGLRIFPLYWLAVLASVLLIAGLGEAASRQYHAAMGLQLSGKELLRNLLLVLDVSTSTRWVPPAWALTVEIFYYVLMGLGLSRWWWSTLAWLGASVLYTGYLLIGEASFSYRYFPIAAASLPFSVGAGLFHLRRVCRPAEGRPGMPRGWVVVSLAFVANLLWATQGGAEVERAQFYGNLVLAAAMTWLLAGWQSPRLAASDASIGELSYPVYLLHYQAGLALLLLGLGGAPGSWGFMAAGLGVALLMAWAVSRTLEPLIQGVRSRVRARGGAVAARTPLS
jgi:peptidoglycan/LPS O-acetylase OafA/YrhL